ncbi:hypothetical protein ABIE44_002955 [Marmoricola sp. OAE513]|uniref:PLDc N-terminal domain-containing protein n=1 Tax=Marmoricola sp. OAE513 TaxID=2817894 RepID=UPI001AE4BF52
MLRFYEGWFLVVLVLDIFCVIDIIQSREGEVRNLPKIAWLLLVLFFPLVGSIAWLAVGRPSRQPAGRSPYERSAPAYPEYDRPGRAAGVSAESDDEFLRKVRERAEEQRRRAAEQKKAAQEESEGGGDGSER